jgi:TonB family protein
MPASRAGIPLCVAASVVIHAAVLTLTEFCKSSSFNVYAPTPAIHLRLVSAREPSPDSGQPAGGTSPRAKALSMANLPGKRSADAPRIAEEHVLEEQMHQDTEEIPENVGNASSTRPDSSAQAGALPSYADYIPKAYLTVGPEPLTLIEVQPPIGTIDRHTVTVVLSVFIDEYGKVRQVKVESGGVTPAYADAALQAFEGVSFKPGILNGAAVKSVIKIAVDFEPAWISR